MTAIAQQFDAGGLGESFFDLDRLLETLTGGQIGAAWLVIGVVAQFVIAGCIYAQWSASKRQGRTVIPPSVVYAGLVATVVLLVYASIRHDLVYVIGQLINVVIGMMLLNRNHDRRTEQTDGDLAQFPQVRPESAERGGAPTKIAP